MFAYSALWKAARPLLRRHHRLRQGFDQRLVPPDWPGAAKPESGLPAAGVQAPEPSDTSCFALDKRQEYFDLWIQAASGGESYLVWEILRPLALENPGLRLLCTTCTSQGLDILRQAKNAPELAPLSITLNYLPLDEPALMQRAVAQVFGPLPYEKPRSCTAKPEQAKIPGAALEQTGNAVPASGGRLLILLETEIWPGLLAACRTAGVRVLILNARMTEKSYRGYRLLTPWLRPLAPDAILATGESDLRRFCQLFDSRSGQGEKNGTEADCAPKRILRGLMSNIKFDRLLLQDVPQLPDAPQDASMLLLGSVREEEEADLLLVIKAILGERPQTALVIAPRHMHRVQSWIGRLTAAGLDFCLRSTLTPENLFLPGRIYLWDVFGELGKLYRQANAVFVGGSLAPLGGQNFLEPLAYGLVPCIGPSWSNFAWVGPELFAAGLVRQVQNAADLAPALLELLAAPRSRTDVLNDFRRYLEPRQGGTAQAVNLIQSYL